MEPRIENQVCTELESSKVQILLQDLNLLSEQLKNWDTDKTPALEAFSNVKALLENIKPKLPSEEKRKVGDYINRLQPKKYLVIKTSISELSEDSAWELYTELSGLVTSLQQLAKDSKWD